MTALAKRSVASQATSLAERFGASPEMVDLVRSQIAPGAPDDVLALYFARCQQLGADPLGRMLYVINRQRNVKNDATGRWEKVDNWQLQGSIDLFRSVAESHGDTYAGQGGPYWCGSDGVWRDVWLESTPPAAAKVEVHRHGFNVPLSAVAKFAEYAQTNRDGELTGLWKTMPATMIAKCAEALALRKAFPAKLTGIYTTDEMAQADNPRPAARPVATVEAVDPPALIEGEVLEPSGAGSSEPSPVPASPAAAQAAASPNAPGSITAETQAKLAKAFAILSMTGIEIEAMYQLVTDKRVSDPDGMKLLSENEGRRLAKRLVDSECVACNRKPLKEPHVKGCPEDHTAPVATSDEAELPL